MLTAVATRRVLIVDDADDLRMLVRLRIEQSHHLEVVGEADNGLDAVEQARSLQPDVVILDVAMPQMDGLEALPLIQVAAPHVRVIVMSGFGDQSMEAKALSAGADHYFVKGRPLLELVALVEG